MLGEKPTLSIIAGLLILLGGITLIVQAEPSQSRNRTFTARDGRCSAGFPQASRRFCGAYPPVFFKKASLHLHPLATASIALWVGAATAFLLVLFDKGEESRGAIPSSAWRWIFAAGVCQAVAVPFYNFAFIHTMAVRVTAIVSAQPLIVLLLGWLFLRETETSHPGSSGRAPHRGGHHRRHHVKSVVPFSLASPECYP